eukprot:s2238_g9.t1
MALGCLLWRAWFQPRPRRSLCVAGVAPGDIDNSYGTGLPLVARLVPAAAASLCVGGMPLGDIDLFFARQAWHLVISGITLCGRRGTWRGTWRHRPPPCLASVALGDKDIHFAWKAWHLAASTFTLCGTQALGDIDHTYLPLAAPLVPPEAAAVVWQAWHLMTSTFTFTPGTCGTGLALVALWYTRALRRFVWHTGMPLGDINLHFASLPWAPRYLVWHAGVALGDRPSLCVAGVAPRDIGFHFVWQVFFGLWRAWHLATSTFILCRKHRPTGLALAAPLLPVRPTALGVARKRGAR